MAGYPTETASGMVSTAGDFAHREPRPHGSECILCPRLAPRRWPRHRRWRGPPPQPFTRRPRLPRQTWDGRGRPVSPRSGGAPRSLLPRGQRRGAEDGLAAHPPAWLARRRFSGSGGGTGSIGSPGPGVGATVGLGNPGSRSHHRNAPPGDRIHWRSSDRRRAQYVRRRLFGYRRLGPLRKLATQ